MSTHMQLSKDQLREQKPKRDQYLQQAKTPLVLVLDNVTNSYNVGSFIRLADAFAIEKIIVCGQLTISEKKLRKASRNEAKWVKVEYSDDCVSSLNSLKTEGYKVFGVELCQQSVDYKTLQYTGKSALVLGNERKGVSEPALALADHQIHISMFGMGNSLNVSTAGAIVLAEVSHQLRTNVD